MCNYDKCVWRAKSIDRAAAKPKGGCFSPLRAAQGEERGRAQTGRRHSARCRSIALILLHLFIKARVHIVDVFLVHALSRKPEALAEAYKMEIINLQMRHSILMESLVA